VIAHRQHHQPVTHRSSAGKQRRRLGELLQQRSRNLGPVAPWVAVAGKPPHVGGQDRGRSTGAAKLPADLLAGGGGRRERLGGLVVDQLVGADVDDHAGAVHTADEEVGRMPARTALARPVEPERLGGERDNLGSKSSSIAMSRSTHDS
jgi:hypothetical protein